ncbi:MAG: hypothetical protein RL660_1861 [Bacteroidota bacterium]|jgi:hypothetical protein
MALNLNITSTCLLVCSIQLMPCQTLAQEPSNKIEIDTSIVQLALAKQCKREFYWRQSVANIANCIRIDSSHALLTNGRIRLLFVHYDVSTMLDSEAYHVPLRRPKDDVKREDEKPYITAMPINTHKWFVVSNSSKIVFGSNDTKSERRVRYLKNLLFFRISWRKLQSQLNRLSG